MSRVDADIGPRAAFDVRKFSQNGRKSILEKLLNGNGILLYLGPVICSPHETEVCKVVPRAHTGNLPAMNSRTQHTANTADAT